MMPVQTTVIVVGQHIAVHHKERFIEPRDERQRTGRAQWLLFERVVNAHTELTAVTEVSTQQMGEVTDR